MYLFDVTWCNQMLKNLLIIMKKHYFQCIIVEELLEKYLIYIYITNVEKNAIQLSDYEPVLKKCELNTNYRYITKFFQLFQCYEYNI